MSASLLEVTGVSKAFGGLKAVQDFRLSLPPGALYGLIGPNGAGKTTVFNLLTGVYTPDSGTVTLAGQRLNGMKPSAIAAAGMARTFQNIRLFADLSAIDNVRIGRHLRATSTIAGAILRSRASVNEENDQTRRAMELLELFNLADRAEEPAGSLPYGDQRRLEIARAIATGPKLLLLDEPAAGMNPQEKKQLRELIHRVRKQFNVGVLLIEHDMGVVMDLCERITVLDYGQVIAEGTPHEMQNHPRVIEAYLGKTEDEEPRVLEIRDLDVHYGAVHALKGVSITVNVGEIVTLIGCNGAGKSTTLRAVSGLVRPSRGSISFQGQPIHGLQPHDIVRMGVVQSPEGRGIFQNMSVSENLDLGSYARTDRHAVAADREKALDLFPRLRERISQSAGTLSGGEQQMLAMARALLARPKLLLLDEPSLGLAPQVVRTIFQIIRDINASGTTILLVEQNAHMALKVAHSAHVLEVGEVVMSGKAADLAASDDVRRAYLGVGG